MKKLINLIILVAIATVAFVACTKPEVNSTLSQNNEIVLTFTSAKPELADEAPTKTVWDANSQSINWSTADKIRVALKVGDKWQNGSGDATDASGKGPKLYESIQAGSVAEIIHFKVPTNFNITSTGDYKFYGIYPSSTTSTDANYTYMPSINVTLPTEQTPNAGTFDPNGDIMIAESEDGLTGIPEGRVISLSWSRLVAHGDITLKKLPSFESDEVIRSITLSAQEGADLSGEHYLMLTNGEFSGNKGVNYVTIKAKNGNLDKNADGNIEFWFTSLPFTATSLKVAITTNKYIYTKEYSEISKQFMVNTRNILGFSMSNCSKVAAPAEQLIEDGFYVISTTYNQTDLMMVGNDSANYQDFGALATTIEDGKLKVEGNAAWFISFDSDNDVFYIQNADYETYLGGLQTSGSNLKLVSEEQKVGFTISEVEGGYHIIGTNNRWIGYNHNNGSGRFAMYSNDASYPGVITFTPAKTDLVASLVFTTTEKEIAAATEIVEFPFVAHHLTTPISASIKTSSDDIIAENGIVVGSNKISITLKPNTDAVSKSATIVVSTTGVEDQELVINQKAHQESSTIAPLNTVLFSESFSGFSSNDVPTQSNSSTTVFEDLELAYTCSGSGTKIYTGTMSAGGSSPEILINGSFKIAGIPTGSAKKITLSYGSNKGTGTLHLEVTGGTIGTISNSDKTYTGIITPTSNTIDLTFSASSNSRLDDIVLIVSEAGDESGTGGETTTVATPTFSVSEGTYTTSQSVEIACDTEGATIYYTLDGSDPDDESNEYETAISISTTTTIKAIAIKDNVASEIAEVTYTISEIEDDAITVNMSSFSAISGYVNGDSNVSYAASQGSAGNAPVVNSNEIRIYQNGGLLTITANNNKKITGITIGSSMVTTVQVKVDSGSYSSDNSISAGGTYSTGTINASSVVFKCTGTDKNHRLYLNYLSVTYEN